jgi:hypothetical protein
MMLAHTHIYFSQVDNAELVADGYRTIINGSIGHQRSGLSIGQERCNNIAVAQSIAPDKTGSADRDVALAQNDRLQLTILDT